MSLIYSLLLASLGGLVYTMQFIKFQVSLYGKQLLFNASMIIILLKYPYQL